MDEKIVRKYYELNQKLKDIQEERDRLNKILKSEMLGSNLSKAVVGEYLLELKTQDRSKYDDSIVEYLKKNGLKDLLVESFDEEKLKERIRAGLIEEQAVSRYKVERIVHVLNISPVKPSFVLDKYQIKKNL